MRVLELFAGYGSQALALENLGIEFTSDISEIDKYAIQAYEQLHGKTHNWGDITKIDEKDLPYYDFITYSFPCQDISLAGLQRGLDNESGTRSSLLWECERIIRAVKPKYLLLENVKNLVGEKHKPNFIKWLKVLEGFGYQNFWKVLNAKDYGVPQNRERVFVVSILGGGQYLFPNPIKLEKRLKDVLEHNVDEKYYIDSKLLERLPYQLKLGTSTLDADIVGTQCARQYSNYNGAFVSEPTYVAQRGREDGQQLEVQTEPVTNTLTTVQKDNYIVEPIALDEQNKCLRYNGTVGTLTTDGSSPKHNNRVIEPQVMQIGNIVETDSFGGNPQFGRIYSDNGLSPTLNTMQGGGREPKIIEDFYKNRNPREYTNESPAIRSERSGLKVNTGYRIRKLTPRECWRLMGVRDEQFDKLHDISNTQLYKLAGNSIVVDVLMGIFKNLFLSDEDTKGQLTLL